MVRSRAFSGSSSPGLGEYGEASSKRRSMCDLVYLLVVMVSVRGLS